MAQGQSAGAPLLLADELETDPGKVALNLEKAAQACAKLRCYTWQSPDVHPPGAPVVAPAGMVKLLHMPLKQPPFEHQIKSGDKVVHLFDAILDHEEDVDLALIKGLLAQGDYAGLPDPIRPKGVIASLFKMSVAVVRNDNGKHDIYKYFQMEKAPLKLALKLCHNPLIVLIFTRSLSSWDP